MARTRFQARERPKIVTLFFRGSHRKNEMEGPPYMKTYVKISPISNQLVYSLYLKFCRIMFVSSFEKHTFAYIPIGARISGVSPAYVLDRLGACVIAKFVERSSARRMRSKKKKKKKKKKRHIHV